MVSLVQDRIFPDVTDDRMRYPSYYILSEDVTRINSNKYKENIRQLFLLYIFNWFSYLYTISQFLSPHAPLQRLASTVDPPRSVLAEASSVAGSGGNALCNVGVAHLRTCIIARLPNLFVWTLRVGGCCNAIPGLHARPIGVAIIALPTLAAAPAESPLGTFGVAARTRLLAPPGFVAHDELLITGTGRAWW